MQKTILSEELNHAWQWQAIPSKNSIGNLKWISQTIFMPIVCYALYGHYQKWFKWTTHRAHARVIFTKLSFVCCLVVFCFFRNPPMKISVTLKNFKLFYLEIYMHDIFPRCCVVARVEVSFVRTRYLTLSHTVTKNRKYFSSAASEGIEAVKRA